MWLVLFDANRDPQSLSPRPFGKFSNVPFAAEQLPLTLIPLQQKAFKVAEPIENQASDLSCEAMATVMVAASASLALTARFSLASAITSGRWQNRGGIAAKRLHASTQLMQETEFIA